MKYTGFYSRIYFRNCEIIDHSDYCVFCVDENADNSGALKALKYAKKKKKTLTNIFSQLPQKWAIYYKDKILLNLFGNT